MNSSLFTQAVENICQKDDRFSRDAYLFLRDVLDFTMRRTATEFGRARHVSGMELLSGFRDYTLQEFGPMSLTVLKEWGLSSGYNVGEMVFALIEAGVFAKDDSDSLEDFKKYQSFRDAFEKPYDPK